MKLSTKSRYGTRFMLELAIRQSEGFVLLGNIARSQNISEKYLWQLASALKAAGLVNAQRGVKGGFALARPAEEISVKDIVCVLEGNIELVDCTGCAREDCLTSDIWKEASRAIEQVLSSYKLSDMAARAGRMRAGQKKGYAAFGV